ncbi:O-antigen ligase family protein [Novosphingobium sp.]|uniref:O-antigen ligase family protein n=1 Tax=Novosphingobium sp. TaxID=1874826 RepID=UPI003D09F2A7
MSDILRPLNRAAIARAAGSNSSLRLAIFAMFTLVALTILGPAMTYKPEPFTGDGSPLRQGAYIALLIAAVYAARPWVNPARLINLPITLIVAIAWCWASLSWSIAPDEAVRRLSLTTIVIWLIFLLVSEIGPVRTLATIRIGLVLTLIANYIAVLLFPNVGIHQIAELFDPGLVGDWRGIMLQKNFAGALCAFTILTFLFYGQRVNRTYQVAVVVAAAFFLGRTVSKTSMGICLLSIVAGFAYLQYNPRYRIAVLTMLVLFAAAVAGYVYIHLDDISRQLNDPGALTGRAQIWPPLLAFSRDHLLRGAGYGSFWNIGFGESPIYRYGKGWVTHITQGHNGYLDMLVTIGVPGLILVIIAVAIAPMARLFYSRQVDRHLGAGLLAMLLFCMGHNFTESSLFDRDTIVQSFLMLTVAMIYAQTQAQPARQITWQGSDPARQTAARKTVARQWQVRRRVRWPAGQRPARP